MLNSAVAGEDGASAADNVDAAPGANEAAVPAKRRRRWEDPAPATAPPAPVIDPSLTAIAPSLNFLVSKSGAVPSPVQAPSLDAASQQAAQDAIRRMSDMLKGNAPLQSTGLMAAGTTALLQLDIDINDSTRKGQLTKKQTHEDITKATGASILIRGRYRPPGDTSTEERPLHLHLEARSQEELDAAEAIIREIMGPMAPLTEETVVAPLPLPPPPSTFVPGQPIPVSRPTGPPPSNAPLMHTCTLEVGVDQAAGYQVRGKLLGPKGSYLKHIQDQTGVRVQLRLLHAVVNAAPCPSALEWLHPTHLSRSSHATQWQGVGQPIARRHRGRTLALPHPQCS